LWATRIGVGQLQRTTLIRKRLVDAAVAKARRGELRIGMPVGYLWSCDDGLMTDPDRRIQDAIRTVFRLHEGSEKHGGPRLAGRSALRSGTGLGWVNR